MRVRVVELTGSRLPARLRDLPTPPDRLYVVGTLPRGASVAIVGTRHPTAESCRFTRKLASELARRGVVVLSGGAQGLDTEAHAGALEVGGTTVVVGPSSFDEPFPDRNAPLFERIVLSGGAYVSEHRTRIKPRRHQFFARNSYLAALADIVIVIETRLRGGARNTAKWARRLGRPLFVVPQPPWNAVGVGCIAELRLGARPLARAEEVLRELGRLRAHPWPAGQPSAAQPELPWNEIRPATERSPLDELAGPPDGLPRPRGHAEKKTASSGTYDDAPDVEKVLEAVGCGPAYPDEIARRTGLIDAAVRECLLTLTLRGILVSHASGSFSVSKS